MRYPLIGFFSALASLAFAAEVEDTLPTAGLSPYSEYRSALIAEGWKPQAQSRSEDGFPEVHCGSKRGNKTCGAFWRSPDGEGVEITLWLGKRGSQTVLVVAPETVD